MQKMNLTSLENLQILNKKLLLNVLLLKLHLNSLPKIFIFKTTKQYFLI